MIFSIYTGDHSQVYKLICTNIFYDIDRYCWEIGVDEHTPLDFRIAMYICYKNYWGKEMGKINIHLVTYKIKCRRT